MTGREYNAQDADEVLTLIAAAVCRELATQRDGHVHQETALSLLRTLEVIRGSLRAGHSGTRILDTVISALTQSGGGDEPRGPPADVVPLRPPTRSRQT